MMLGVSNLMSTSGDGAAAAESGGGSSEVGASMSVPGEEIDRSGGGGGGGGGNRWPRQETLALLKIRSDMDVAFRDSSLKGPLWDQVSRKLAELGFQRSAKKCKEKFENVFKYHKRTKDGRGTKSDGKTYRFFDQLEALEKTPRPPPASAAGAGTVSSASPNPLSVVPPIQTSNNLITSSPFQPPPSHTFLPSHTHFPASLLSVSASSSSTSSDEGIQRRKGKKRKWKDFFHGLMKDVICRQEELQRKFLETLEKRERDRSAREEAWRAQEMARLNREHDFLVQERSIAAAKDTAVIAFLQKVTEQNNLQLQIPVGSNIIPSPQPPKNPQPPQQIVPPPPPPPPPSQPTDNGGENSICASSSRWPKAEVQALIQLRTSLDLKYQDNAPKGPLWEEISAAMAKLGYNRSPKRCKEKWENINKYFKKVKESSKKRPEDSKTCPYFHQLDAIYKERAKNDDGGGGSVNPMAPIMAQPEQQWPLSDHGLPENDDGEEENEVPSSAAE